jgi:hypothetical protein
MYRYVAREAGLPVGVQEVRDIVNVGRALG